jgi:hypothetical protein
LFHVGSLRNEALAYSLDPKLFEEKVACVYTVGSELNRANDECNHAYDKYAYEIIFNAPVQKAWIWIDRDNLCQYFTPEHEEAMRRINHPTAKLLAQQLDDFRSARTDIVAMGADHLAYQTNMFGKSLWSNPLFLHALGLDAAFGLEWTEGRCFYDVERSTCFEPIAGGRDRLLVKRDSDKIATWVLDRLRELAVAR